MIITTYEIETADKLANFLPDELLSRAMLRMRNPVSRLFLAQEGSDCLGYAIASREVINKQIFDLDDIHVEGEGLTNGVAQSLLAYLEDFVDVEGAEYLRFFSISEDERLNELLGAQGFAQLKEKGHYLVYSGEEVKDGPLSKQLDKLRPLMDRVKKADSLSAEQIAAYKKAVVEAGHSTSRSVYEAAYSQFYIENGQIAASLGMRKAGPSRIVMTDTFLLEGCKSEVALPAMLASFVKDLPEPKKKKDELEICFASLRPEMYKGIRQSFGDPASDLEIKIFVKDI